MARQGKTIDRKEWNATPSLTVEVSTDGTHEGGLLNFSIPGTILRIRGYVSAIFDESSQVGDKMTVTFALGMVSTDAKDVGATALPDPGGEPEYPWLWWGQLRLDSFSTNGLPSASWGPAAQRMEVDSRAMRRFKPRESLVWVVERADAGGAPVTIITTGSTRVLIGT